MALAVGTTPGAVSRLVDLLEREHVVERSASGSIDEVDWKRLVERWATDVEHSRSVLEYFEPRGVEVTIERVRTDTQPLAITGAYAAAEYVGIVPPISIDVYAADPKKAADSLGLRRSDRVANVRIIRPIGNFVFDGVKRHRAVPIVAPIQIAADLWTAPARTKDDYHLFARWLSDNELSWRE